MRFVEIGEVSLLNLPKWEIWFNVFIVKGKKAFVCCSGSALCGSHGEPMIGFAYHPLR